MKDIVKIRKQGKFYVAYEDDSYVINAVMGYKVSNGKIGFPENSLGKVTNALEEYKINYQIIENEKEVSSKKFPKNKYREYLTKGKKNYDSILKINLVVEKIKNLSSVQLEQLIKYIEDL